MSLERDPMTSAMQIIHRMHGQENGEVEFCLFLTFSEAQFESATAIDHLLEDLVSD
jgi:hypothetical protein